MYELTANDKKAIKDFFRFKGLPLNVCVTFADLAMPEDYSEIRSRAEINDFGMKFIGKLELGIPVVSANMESVTGVDMAVALGREGGLGFLPQTVSIEKRVEMIQKIRRTDSAFIKKPLAVKLNSTLADVKTAQEKFGISSFVVINDNSAPIAMLTTRDWRYENDAKKTVAELLPRRTVISAGEDVSLETAVEIIKKHRIEKLPLADKDGKLCGLITAHGLFYKMRHPLATRDDKGRFIAAASIGVGNRFTANHVEEIERQLEAGAILLLVDTARAFSVNVKEALLEIKKKFPDLPLIVGNVSTAKGAKFLFEHGADCVKVNVGAGRVCITRRVAGAGIPQVTAIAECSAIADIYGKTIIGDGGMSDPLDMFYAIAAGADVLMTGNLLVGTEESAALKKLKYIPSEGESFLVKQYEGSASFEAQMKRMTQGTLDRIREPEGGTRDKPIIGTVREIIAQYLNSFRSAMSYYGIASLREARGKVVFRIQTSSGRREGVKK